MPDLETLPFLPTIRPLPEAQRTVGVAALDQAAVLTDLANPRRCPGFVMTPPHVAWSLVTAARAMIPRKDAVFCEWGAGIGLVTLFAARAGFDAWGVEIEPALLAAARDLAARVREPERVVRGSYKPAGFFEGHVTPDPNAMRIDGRDLTRADVTFVYAWPAEIAAVRSFFGNHAAPGAVLIVYEGGSSVTAYRQSAAPVASNAASPLR